MSSLVVGYHLLIILAMYPSVTSRLAVHEQNFVQQFQFEYDDSSSTVAVTPSSISSRFDVAVQNQLSRSWPMHLKKFWNFKHA